MSSIWTIRRSSTDSKLTGLCGGVAHHWGVDPVLIRVGCALLALSGGIGLVLYLAGWLLIPVEGKKDAPIHDLLGEQARGWPREVWIIVVAISCLLAFGIFGSFTPFGFGPAVILALIWYFGYFKNRQPRPDDPSGPESAAREGGPAAVAPQQYQFFSYPGPPTAFTQAAEAWRQRIVEFSQRTTHAGADQNRPHGQPEAADEESPEPDGPASSLPPAQPLGAGPAEYRSAEYSSFLAAPDPVGLYGDNGLSGDRAARDVPATVNRSRSASATRLRLISLVALGLTLSGLGVVDALVVSIPLAAYFAAALLVLGLTLVAAAWLGRARGILPVALVVLLATIGTSVGGPVAQHRGWGSELKTYTSASQLASGDDRELGELKVDLTGLKLTSDASYTAHVDVGALEVSVPPELNVRIIWTVKSGAFVVDDQETQAGSDLGGVVDPANPDAAVPTLTLNVSVDRGKVQVRR
ncbi:MAG: PspC domain-containing protein [Propionibacteriaceae bacterium]|nr:PspC domain-containing protein [Propionibacteriaceae bacterium]